MYEGQEHQDGEGNFPGINPGVLQAIWRSSTFLQGLEYF